MDVLIKFLKDIEKDDSKIKFLILEDYVLMSMVDMFVVGFEFLILSFLWVFFFFNNYFEIQWKVYCEFDEVIGFKCLLSF